MLPIQSNSNQLGAPPISSNAIIWQGSDIPCINLCKGDTISDVIAKLAQDLCDLMDQFDITSFDLTCFNPICPTPENTHDLIQFLVQQVCALNGIIIPPSPGEAGCPDCIVNIAPCFYFNNPIGDQVTTMQLQDYVTAIGNKLCGLVTEIATLQATVTNLSGRVNTLEQTIANLPAPTESLLPTDCLINNPPPGGTPISVVVLALEQAFCELRSSTGLPNDIFASITKQCGNLNTLPSLAQPGINMGSISGWQNTVFNLAGSINNLWLTICDMRNAVLNIQTNCCPSGCDGVVINMTATFNGSDINVVFTGSIPNITWTNCAPNLLTITDSGSGSISQIVTVIGNFNNTISIPIGVLSPTSNYTLHLQGCFTDGSNTCNRDIFFTLVNDAACPTLTVVPTTSTIPWTFTNVIPGTITYTVQLWNSTGTLLLDSVTASVGPGIITGTFSTSISDGTTYLIRVGIQQGIAPIVFCPFDSITTLPGSYFLWGGASDLFIQPDGSFFLTQ